MLLSKPCTGLASSISSALPLVGFSSCGMSSRTTSPSSFCASINAVVAPVNPAPMTVILLRLIAMKSYLQWISLTHIFNDQFAEFRAFHFGCAFHQTCEVVCDRLVMNRLFHAFVDQACRFQPAHMLK